MGGGEEGDLHKPLAGLIKKKPKWKRRNMDSIKAMQTGNPHAKSQQHVHNDINNFML